MLFLDRVDAGKRLAERIREQGTANDIVVYALPRGGVILGAEVARALSAPLELALVRKIGHPLQPEYAVCALAEGGQLVCNEAERALLDEAWLQRAIAQARTELQRQRELYLAGRLRISAQGKTAILVDDGIATGLTMKAAVAQAKAQAARRIIVAAPVMPPEAAKIFAALAGKVVAVEIPTFFLGAVGAYYVNFPPVSDEEIIRLLRETQVATAGAGG